MFSLFFIAAWLAAPLTTRIKQHQELAALTEQHESARRENQRLRREIVRLKDDPDYWEILARRDLQYVKGDEEAYVVVEQPLPVAPTPAAEPEPTIWETVLVRVKDLSVMF